MTDKRERVGLYLWLWQPHTEVSLECKAPGRNLQGAIRHCQQEGRGMAEVWACSSVGALLAKS